MYTPPHFRNDDTAEIREFIQANSFAALVSRVKGGLWATHLPLLLETEAGRPDRLTGHVSRANVQWRGWRENPEVLAIFQGPHAYVSSTWYNHTNVPTWNYIAAHAYGTARLLEGEALRRAMERLVKKYEPPGGFTMEDLPAEQLERQLRGIVGVEIEVRELQAAYKLSQNRDAESYDSVVNHLVQKEDPGARAVAEEMRKRGHF